MTQANFDIIYLSLFRWNGPYSSISIAMAKEFAKTRRVFYINHPFTLKDAYKKDPEIEAVLPKLTTQAPSFYHPKEFPNLTIITPPATLPINFMPPGWMYRQLTAKNNRLIYKLVADIIKKYNIEQYVYLNCFDPFYAPTLPKELAPIANVYQCVDDISQESYVAKHGFELEEEAIRQADLTLTTSQELFRLKSPLTKNIEILSNAADIDNFQRAVTEKFLRPKELADINTPIIGYIGNLDSQRVNYDLLKTIAITHKDKNLVFIGPINNNRYIEIGLDQLPNVHFLGGKPIEELPRFLQYFDVCVIPFSKNTLTKSIYPLKINEYLAAGKPVISTNFSPDIADFQDYIFLANTDEEFNKFINTAITANHPDQINNRVKKAADNTWTARIQQFDNLVEQIKGTIEV